MARNLVNASQKVVTARQSSSFECAGCHDAIPGGTKYVLHDFVNAGPQGGRWSEKTRYHPDCHDPPKKPPAASGKPSGAPTLTGHPVELIAIVVVAAVVGVILVYCWFTRKKKPEPA